MDFLIIDKGYNTLKPGIFIDNKGELYYSKRPDSYIYRDINISHDCVSREYVLSNKKEVVRIIESFGFAKVFNFYWFFDTELRSCFVFARSENDAVNNFWNSCGFIKRS